MSLIKLKKDVRRCANAKKARFLQRFFKTGPGEYAAGDRFLGVVVPKARKIARKYRDLPLTKLQILLRSPYHEERLIALLILVSKYERDPAETLFRFYVRNVKHINNWDLVDLSAPKIVGAHFLKRSRRPLYRWVRSPNLWQRRIAILATFTFIRNGSYTDILRFGKILLKDDEDLIHKAMGWMLRELGKRDLPTEERFLRQNAHKMPRTMLRYAIEKFPAAKRRKYLEQSNT